MPESIAKTKEIAAPEGRKMTQHERDEHRLARIKSWRDQEIARQQANRYQMQLDEDFYDGLQWDLSEQRAVLARGQNPVVYNEVKPTVDWLIGMERKTRTDFKVTPTAKGEQAALDATNKTKLLKYISEVNRSEFTRSQAFDDALKAGLGWIETGIRADPDEEPIFDRAESWRNVLYDSLGSALDLSDSRYLIRMRWVDLDIALAHFPDKKDLLRRASEGNPESHGVDWWFGQRLSEIDTDEPLLQGRWNQYDAGAWHYNPRDRVQLFECWYYEPFEETVDPGKTYQHTRVRMKMRATVFVDAGILWDDWSPYKHNRFPLIPVWCYRRKRDGAPYGVIRNIRGPQESLNKRMSKTLHILSANRIHAEAGAIDDSRMDADEIAEEAAAPDGFVQWADGALSGNKVVFQNDQSIATGHLALAERDKMTIREVGGVTSENLGRDTNLVSGVALKQKEQQGSTVTLQPFDHLRLARQLEGELKLSLIEQYYTEEKVFRITGDRNTHDFVEINSMDPETGEILNDVTAMKASFVIDEQDYRESMMQAVFEQLMDLMMKIGTVNPQFAMNTIDLVMEYAPVPYKDGLIKRIRAMTGQVDPDQENTPEFQQQKAQAAQAEAELQMENLRAMRAKTALDEAKAAAQNAATEKTGAQIAQLDAQTVKHILEAIYAATQSAGVVAATPGVAPVADELLKSAGFVDKNAAPIYVPPGPSAPAVPGAVPPPAAGGGPLPPPAPSVPPPAPAGQDGMTAGIETARHDGAPPQ